VQGVPRSQPIAPRRYNSRRRAQQAEQTRGDVLAAAVDLFAERGWAATTVAAVAEQADVAVETVYRGFDSKKELLRQASQVAIVGDAEPVPLVDRDEMRALRTGPLEQRRRATAHELLTLYRDRRVAAIWAAMLEAAAGDPEIAAWCNEEERRRHAMIEVVLSALQRDHDATATDVIWLVSGPESYRKLTAQRGWTPEQWADWVIDTIERVTTPLASDG
jgi:AcrR family transcriptional regulator